MIESLKLLIKEWEDEYHFLGGDDEHEIDRAVGETYHECASKLKEILSSITPVQGDAEKRCVCETSVIGENGSNICADCGGKIFGTP